MAPDQGEDGSPDEALRASRRQLVAGVAGWANMGREQASEIGVGWTDGWIEIGGLRCATVEGSRFCRLQRI